MIENEIGLHLIFAETGLELIALSVDKILVVWRASSQIKQTALGVCYHKPAWQTHLINRLHPLDYECDQEFPLLFHVQTSIKEIDSH